MDKIAGGAGVATTRLGGGGLRSCKIKVNILTPGRRERRGKEGVKDPTGNVQKENSQIEILFVCLSFFNIISIFHRRHAKRDKSQQANVRKPYRQTRSV